MREREEGKIYKFCALLLLLCTLSYSANGQVSQALDTIKHISQYPYPIPKRVNWGHDVYGSLDFLLKRDTMTTGYWIQDYDGEEDLIARIFFIKDGSLHGRDVFFDTLQNLEFIIYYDKNDLIAKSEYYNSKMIKDSTHYRKNSITSYIEWYENGNKRYQGTAESQVHFYPNGELHLKKSFKDKKLHGVVEYYKQNGAKYLINFEDGRSEKYCIAVTKTNPDKKIRYKKILKKDRNFIEYNYFR